MKTAEYRIVRNAPLEWRGALDLCVRVVIILIVLPNAFAYSRL